MSLREGGDAELDLELESGTTLRIEVFDRDRGVPVPGARLLLLSSGPDALPLAVTDSAGAAELRVAPGADLPLAIGADGYCLLEWTWTDPRPDPTRPQRLPLVRAAWIECRVEDASGEPVAAARLDAHADGANVVRPIGSDLRREWGLPGGPAYLRRPPGRRVSDEAGLAAVAVVPSDRPYTVLASHPEYPLGVSEPVLVAEAGARASAGVTLRRGATVRGRVLYGGSPLPLAQVFWSGEAGNRGSKGADAEGRYELSNVVPGRVEVGLAAHPLAESYASAWLEVRAGVVHEHDVRWAVATRPLSGSVRSGHGAPLAGTPVTAAREATDLLGAGPVVFETETASDGTYSLEVPADWTCRVTAARDGVQDTRTGVAAGTGGVDLVLRAEGRLLLRFRDGVTGDVVRPAAGDLRRGLARRAAGGDRYEPFERPSSAPDATGAVELRGPVGEIDIRYDAPGDGWLPAELLGVRLAEEVSGDLIEVRLARR